MLLNKQWYVVLRNVPYSFCFDPTKKASIKILQRQKCIFLKSNPKPCYGIPALGLYPTTKIFILFLSGASEEVKLWFYKLAAAGDGISARKLKN